MEKFRKSDSLVDAGGIPTWASCPQCGRRYRLAELVVVDGSTLCPAGHILTRWAQENDEDDEGDAGGLMVCPRCRLIMDGPRCWKCGGPLEPEIVARKRDRW